MLQHDQPVAIERGPDKLRAENSIESIFSAVEALMCIRDAARIREDAGMHRAIDLVARAVEEHITIIDDIVFPGRRNIGSAS